MTPPKASSSKSSKAFEGFNLFLKIIEPGAVTNSAPFKKTRSFRDFCEMNDMDADLASIIVFIMNAYTWAVIDNEGVGSLTFDVKAEGDTGYKKAIDGLKSEEIETTKGLIEANKVSTGFHLYELVACYQVKSLSADNISNYFKSVGFDRINATNVLKVVSYASTCFPEVMRNPDYQAKLSKSDYVRYHTAYSSTPSLVLKVIDAVGENALGLFGREVVDLVKAAIMNPSDIELNAKIPKTVTAFTRLYLSKYGILPNNWYQGEKCFNDAAPTLIKKWSACIDFIKEREVLEYAPAEDGTVADAFKKIGKIVVSSSDADPTSHTGEQGSSGSSSISKSDEKGKQPLK